MNRAWDNVALLFTYTTSRNVTPELRVRGSIFRCSLFLHFSADFDTLLHGFSGLYQAYNARKDLCPHLNQMESVGDAHSCRLNMNRVSVYKLKKATAAIPEGAVPQRKPGSEAQRKTSPRRDKVLKREVKQ